MTNQAIEFFAAVTHPALVFGGPNGNFILLPLGTGDPADPEVIIDGVARGFRLVGYVGECRDCGGIMTHSDLETADGALVMVLAPARYAAYRVLRARQVSQLEALYAQTKGPTMNPPRPIEAFAAYPANTLEGMIAREWVSMIRECEDHTINPEPIAAVIATSRALMRDAGWPATYQHDYLVRLRDDLTELTQAHPVTRQFVQLLTNRLESN
jgi:hypothetical protein